MTEPARDRIAALDLIRGVAVLGILAVNVAGFAGPSAATLSPHIPNPGGFADEAAYAGIFLVFEGKMRALFSLLFGASMVLFLERAEARRQNGDLLQLRRLGWLMLFGLLHYFLFWWGDILFIYAVCGAVALALRQLPVRGLIVGALIVFAAWHIAGAARTMPRVVMEDAVRQGVATAAQKRDQAAADAALLNRARSELREYRSGYTDQIAAKLRERPFFLLEMAFSSVGETLPLILIGMALQRRRVFSGGCDRRTLRRWGAAGLIGGAIWTLAILAWAWPRHFPPYAMSAALMYWAAPAHLAMALGYAMLLAGTARRIPARGIAAGGIGVHIARAGRMAFSNYLGATVAMTAIFYGWGLGLIGRVSQGALLGFVLLGWAAMLLASTAWLAQFRQGPLEWLWRSLAEGRLLPLRH